MIEKRRRWTEKHDEGMIVGVEVRSHETWRAGDLTPGGMIDCLTSEGGLAMKCWLLQTDVYAMLGRECVSLSFYVNLQKEPITGQLWSQVFDPGLHDAPGFEDDRAEIEERLEALGEKATLGEKEIIKAMEGAAMALAAKAQLELTGEINE